MKLTPTAALGAIEQCCRRLGERLPENRQPPEQATLVTQVLHEAGLGTPLVACRIGNGRGYLHVLDGDGQPRPAWAAALTGLLEPARLPASLPLVADGIALPGHTLAIEQRVWQETTGVVVACAVRADQPADEVVPLRQLLAVCAAQVLPYVALHARERALADCREELAGELSNADLGTLAQPLAHEFNNFLNNLVLHLAVLEHQLGEAYRPKLAQVRQLGTEIAQLVKRYQQYRQRHAANPQAVDLNVLLREALQAAARPDPRRPETGPPRVTLDLSPDLPGLMGTTADVRRCCTFLIANALRAAETGQVRVRTELTDQRLLLHVEDEGPSAAPDDLHQLFELGKKSRPGTEPLELAACQSIVRRMGGRLQAANRAEKGVGITADFPVPPR
ncbi:MAG: HAMP domain-containing histidine kinase [Planctomycetia bacterium]|nr:HAMP domain-containing histidine kinase [Planctomycetia bacterium]